MFLRKGVGFLDATGPGDYGGLDVEMFIRFVTDRLDEDTGAPSGVFAVAYQLLRSDEVDDYYRTEIRTSLDWFESHLPIPARFRRSRRPNRQDRGICWFKTEASECMGNVRYLVQLVQEQDIAVREVMTDTPGYRIYEDDCQIVAEPFSSTPR